MDDHLYFLFLILCCLIIGVAHYIFVLLLVGCSMLAEDAIKAAIKDLQDKGAVPTPEQRAEAA